MLSGASLLKFTLGVRRFCFRREAAVEILAREEKIAAYNRSFATKKTPSSTQGNKNYQGKTSFGGPMNSRVSYREKKISFSGPKFACRKSLGNARQLRSSLCSLRRLNPDDFSITNYTTFSLE